MGGWTFADLWEIVAGERGDAVVQLHGERRYTWAEFDRRADNLAATMLAAGLGRDDKVAQYLYNGIEYLESVFAASKASLVSVNTNYRYTDEELVYLWDNADAAAVVFSGEFTSRAAAVRPRVPGVKLWLWADDGTAACPSWAVPYEDAARGLALGADAPRHVTAPGGRDGSDLVLLYTGGTTGYPKGVMWAQDDIIRVLIETLNMGPEVPDERDVAAFRAAFRASDISQVVTLPAAPLMHGTGLMITCLSLIKGARIVFPLTRRFDPVEVLDTIERQRVNTIVIVGDPFCRPLVDALDANPGRWDLSELFIVASSGAMWSRPVKDRLLAHLPGLVLVDALGSSEAMSLGTSISTGSAVNTARFSLGSGALVIDDDNHPVAPGSGVVGRLALRRYVPLGYYKDPARSAATFPVIDGVRYSVPGDYATVEADGTITLLGRGSMVINTGGEKVFPEEVEEALKTHPSVRDAVAVGVPDERFGEQVVALVELDRSPDPGEPMDEGEVIAHVREHLAAYKAPKHIVTVDSVGRAANGKVDYVRLRQVAEAELGHRD